MMALYMFAVMIWNLLSLDESLDGSFMRSFTLRVFCVENFSCRAMHWHFYIEMFYIINMPSRAYQLGMPQKQVATPFNLLCVTRLFLCRNIHVHFIVYKGLPVISDDDKGNWALSMCIAKVHVQNRWVAKPRFFLFPFFFLSKFYSVTTPLW